MAGSVADPGLKTGCGSGSAYRKPDPDPDLHQHDADPHHQHRMSGHQDFLYQKSINSFVFFLPSE
jgi:hypothetical protein